MGDIPFFVVFGYEPDRYAIAHYKITSGRALQDDREIILGQGAARNLNWASATRCGSPTTPIAWSGSTRRASRSRRPAA
ncbi:MAG: hypothetical protein U0470_04660 [Anaerolineae bacterium]